MATAVPKRYKKLLCCLVRGCRRVRCQQWLETLRPITSAEAQVIHQAMPHDFVSGCRLPRCQQSLETLHPITSAEAQVNKCHRAVIGLLVYLRGPKLSPSIGPCCPATKKQRIYDSEGGRASSNSETAASAAASASAGALFFFFFFFFVCFFFFFLDFPLLGASPNPQ